MKMGAAKSDRIYEDITDKKKLHTVLSEVWELHWQIHTSTVHFIVLG